MKSVYTFYSPDNFSDNSYADNNCIYFELKKSEADLKRNLFSRFCYI